MGKSTLVSSKAAIIIRGEALEEIKKFLEPSNTRKIAAIKLLRKEANLGLKEAKYAIEKLQHERFGGNYPNQAREGQAIICGPRIKKIVVNMGDGDIEVDIEQMQMKALSELHIIGLEACGEILDLVEALKAFSDGKKIGAIKNES